MQSWVKRNVKRPEWKALYILWVFLYERVCVCVCTMCTCMLACKFVFMGSTLLSSSFWRVRECLCVSAFSAGTISVEGKEHRETLKELLCSFEWNDPKKGFSWKKGKLFIQASTSRRALTQLPSSLPPFLHPSIPPLFLGPRLRVDALPWAKSMSLVVVNVGHVSKNTVSQPFVTSFGVYCKNSKEHGTRKQHIQELIFLKFTVLKQEF